MSDNRERMRLQEIEGYAEAADHEGREHSGVFAEEREGRIYTMTNLRPRQTHGSFLWATFVMLQLGAKMLKMGLLIFDKLDSIEKLLIEIWHKQGAQ